MPRLTVLTPNESFASVWPALAADAGLELDLGGECATGSTDVLAVNLAGSEETLGAVLARVAGSTSRLVAVGATPDHRLALSAVRAGAAEYFALPQDYELLRRWLGEQAASLRSQELADGFPQRAARRYRFDGILGESPTLREALDRATRVIPHRNVTVLVTGETGTGKELLARAIHYNGPRRAAPFVDVNCAAIPDQLLESELFGHEKGAFTDAGSAKPGLFEVADGGTLFLDEVGHLSPLLQGKLLRVLEQRTIRRVGGTTSRGVDVRIVAATHVDLAHAVSQGQFREDLYYRLNVVTLGLPPLRHRAGDVVLLARAFLQRFAQEYRLPPVGITAAATERLTAHGWRGNVRELRNVMERAILLCRGGMVDVADLQLAPHHPPVEEGAVPFPATMAEITRAAAHGMVRVCAGNKSQAARRLGISRTRLLRLLHASRHAGLEDIDEE